MPDAAILLDAALGHLGAGRPDDAYAALAEALAREPDQMQALETIVELELATGRLAEALGHLGRLVKLRPRDPRVHRRIDDVVLRTARGAQLRDPYRRALGLVSRFEPVPVELCDLLLYFADHADGDGLRALGDPWALVESVPPAWLPRFLLRMFPYASTVDDGARLKELHRRWAIPVEEEAARTPLPGAPPRHSGGPLRIGLLAWAHRNNNVLKFLLPLLEKTHSPGLELYGYSTGARLDDPMEEELGRHLRRLDFVDALSPRDTARAIRADGCHVLIDLDGHGVFSRTAALAWRPCEVQLHWMNWPGTLGLRAVDHVIVDELTRPEGNASLCERPLVLAPAAASLERFPDQPAATRAPARKNGYVTFGTLASPYKWTPQLVRSWAEVLRRVPGARFRMVRPELSQARLGANVTREFARHGIDADRLELVGNRAHAGSHLAHYDAIDICLDSFPLCGGSTTADALWMGVPVVSITGPNLHQKPSAAFLQSIGEGALACRSLPELWATSVELAGDLGRLDRLRGSLRARLRGSKWFQTTQLAASFEAMIRDLVARARGD